jgi:hypothetical protein
MNTDGREEEADNVLDCGVMRLWVTAYKQRLRRWSRVAGDKTGDNGYMGDQGGFFNHEWTRINTN